MAIDLKLIGEKGHRQLVKTIDIHEDSYEFIMKMINFGQTSSEEKTEHLIEDMMNVFCGDAFDATIRLALHCTLTEVLYFLHDNGATIKCQVGEMIDDFIESLFPCMCYSGEEQLFFFSKDEDDIHSVFEKYLKPEYIRDIKDALYSGSIDGNAAFGLLLYLRSSMNNTNE